MAFKLERREERPATIAEHRALRDEIARLKEQLSHGMPAIEELTKEREMYRMRWLGSVTTRDAQIIRDENERLRARLREIEAQSIATTEPDYVAVPAKLIYEQSAGPKNGD